MPQSLNTSLTGLWTNSSGLSSAAPDGALARADNIVIDRPGVGTPVRGMEHQTYAIPSNESIVSFFSYDGANYVTTASGIYRDTGSAYTAVTGGPGSAPSGALVRRAATANGDLFIASSSGLKHMDGSGGAFVAPGAPRMLDAFDSGTPTVGTGWLAPTDVVAYRATVVRFDAESREVEGAPSGRLVLIGGAPANNPYVYYPLGSDIQVGDMVRLYRTATVPTGVDPGDSMAVVAEHYVTAGDVTNKYVNITDYQPDTLRGKPLYTNATLGGMAVANMPPPIAVDMAVFRDCLFLANTTSRQTLTIRMLGLPTVGDELTIGGLVYTADNTTVPDLGAFTVVTTGTASQNIAATALELVEVINRRSGNTSIYAYYTSGDTDAPGIITLETRAVDGAAFTAVADANGERYVPPLTSAQSSRSDVRPNRLHYSKQGLPYAFPLANTLAVGAEEKPIVRIFALRDSLFILKDGDGLWKVTGPGPGAFYVQQVHQTLSLIAPESLAVVDNTGYALTDIGVVEISETGVESISLPIDNLIRDRLLRLPAAVARETFGVGSEKELRYMLYLPDDADGTPEANIDWTNEAYVYTIDTQSWTRREDGLAVAGAVGSDGKLRLGIFEADYAKVERRTGLPADYVGPRRSQPVVTGATGGTTSGYATALTLSTTFDVRVGDVVAVGDGAFTRVEATNGTALGNASWFRTEREIAITVPVTISVYEPIHIAVSWPVNDAGNPSAMKQFSEAALLTEQPQVGVWHWSFANDLAPDDPSTVEGESDTTPYCRVWVPDDVQKTTRLVTTVERDVAGEQLDIIGLETTVRIFASSGSATRLAR